MSAIGKLMKWGSLAALIYSLVYFRGDKRYTRMKAM